VTPEGQPQTTTNYYNHGLPRGRGGDQIDQYRSLGVGLKPTGSSSTPRDTPTTIPVWTLRRIVQRHARCVRHLLECDVEGWASGMASVDPSLNAGSTPRSRSTQLQPGHCSPCRSSSQSPSGTAARRDRRRDGSNIRGYISFAAACTPASTLAQEESTLLNPPWSGQFNTLQFNRACMRTDHAVVWAHERLHRTSDANESAEPHAVQGIERFFGRFWRKSKTCAIESSTSPNRSLTRRLSAARSDRPSRR